MTTLIVIVAVAVLTYAGVAGAVRATRWIDGTADDTRCACGRWHVRPDTELLVADTWHGRHACVPDREWLR